MPAKHTYSEWLSSSLRMYGIHSIFTLDLVPDKLKGGNAAVLQTTLHTGYSSYYDDYNFVSFLSLSQTFMTYILYSEAIRTSNFFRTPDKMQERCKRVVLLKTRAIKIKGKAS